MANVFDQLQDQKETFLANQALDYHGAEQMRGLGPATAAAILRSREPAAHQKTWEELDAGEKLTNALEGGYHGLKISMSAASMARYAQEADAGLSAFESEIDGHLDDESRAAIMAALKPGTSADRKYRAEYEQKMVDESETLAKLREEQSQFAVPVGIRKLSEQTKGKGLVDTVSAAYDTLGEDFLSNMVYLGVSSAGAVLPGLALSPLTGGLSMGLVSYANEYGATVLDNLEDKYKLKTSADILRAYRDTGALDEAMHKARLRATVVGGIDMIAARAGGVSLSPVAGVRSALRMVRKNALGVATRTEHALAYTENMVNQMALQGVLGGAGEAFGNLVQGKDISWADVIYEALGEFTSAPTEVVMMSLNSVIDYQNATDKATVAKAVEETMKKVTAVAEAAALDLKDSEAVDAWADRVGENKSLHAFAQSIVDDGVIDRLREIAPELAKKIEAAAKDAQVVEVPVSAIVKIATKDRELANTLIHNGRLTVDGMSPKEAEDFKKNGKAEYEQQFDKAFKATRATTEIRQEARDVADGIKDQLIAAGTDEETAALQVKPWELVLTSLAAQIGDTPTNLANRYGITVIRANGGVADVAANPAQAAVNASARSQESFGQPRTKEAPKKTRLAFKLMRIKRDEQGNVLLDEAGNPRLFPLFIDANDSISIGQWHDAVSPSFEEIRDLDTYATYKKDGKDVPFGDYYVKDGKAITMMEFAKQHPEVKGSATRQKAGRADIEFAAKDGGRFMRITKPEKSASAVGRYGVPKRFYNLGLNGVNAVTEYALRAGWHAGTAPSMLQIGKNDPVTRKKAYRGDDEVWVEGEVSADIDYQAEADAQYDGDLATKMPTDGVYTYYTNADKSKKSEGADWVIAGSFKPNRVLSDAEARAIVDKQNAENGTAIPHDYPRMGGREFNAETFAYDESEGSFKQGEAGEAKAEKDQTLDEYLRQHPEKVQAVNELKEIVMLPAQRKIAEANRARSQRVYQTEQQRRVVEAAKKVGFDITDLTDQRTVQFLRDVIVDEVTTALRDMPSALGWYNEKVRKCLAIAGILFPEIRRGSGQFDANKEFAFIYAVAVTSNGLEVKENLPIAVEAYIEYRKTGKFKLVGHGTAMRAINQSLEAFPILLKNFENIDEMRQFFMTEWTVKQLTLMGIDVGGEGAAEMVRGAAVLGPKIGNGFFSNLYGLYSALTMDRWFMRTIGRWTGTVFADTSGNVQRGLEKVRQYINGLKKNKEDLKKAGEYFGVDLNKELTDEDLMKLTERWALRWVPSTVRHEHEELFGTAKAQSQRTAFNSLGKYVTDGLPRVEQLAPTGAEQRANIRSIFNKALETIHARDGMSTLSMADLQALLWYAEKRLYESTALNPKKESGADYGKSEKPDYETAMIKVAREKGISEADIEKALAGVDAEIEQETKNGQAAKQRYEVLEPETKFKVLERTILGNNRRQVGSNGGKKQGESRNRVYKREESEPSERSRRLSGEASGSDARETERVHRRSRTLKARLGEGVSVLARWTPGSALKNGLLEIATGRAKENARRLAEKTGKKIKEAESVGDGATAFNEVVADDAGVAKFRELITKAKTSRTFGACVEVKSVEELKTCRLFLSDNGKAGFAIKDGDDIVSVFSEKGSQAGLAIMQCAIAAGGRRLDCFDTYLPDFYAKNGFVPVARLAFNPDFAPDGWNYSLFGEFNGGKPDIVFMVFDPRAPIVNDPDAVQVDYVTDYDEGTAKQQEKLAELKASTDAFRSAVMEASDSNDTAFFQGSRGEYFARNAENASPLGGVMRMMETADKSTFLHESAHAWLDMYTLVAADLATRAARGEQLTEGQQRFLGTVGDLLRWGQREGVIDLGITDDPQTVLEAVRKWRGLSIDEQRGMHELFAEGFESYLLDGNYPSASLKKLFQKFASWLKQIYITATRRPRPISPEIKKLYDHLFLTEQEVANAETRAGMEAMFAADDANSPLSDAEKAEYDRLKEEASQEAQGIVSKALGGIMRRYTRLRTQTVKAIQKQHKARVDARAEELKKEERHVTRELLLEGIRGLKGERRQRIKLDPKAMLAAGFSPETIKALKKKGFIYTGEKNVTPISPAELLGLTNYKTEVDLVSALVDTRDPRVEAAEQIAAEIQQETGEKQEVYTELQADLAAHNALRTKMIIAELNAIARKLGKARMLVSAAADYAAKKIAAMTYDEADPRTFIAAEKKCAREANKAWREGRYEDCLTAKRGQILNHELAKAALAARAKHLKAVNAVRKSLKSKGLYKPYQALLALVAMRHGVIGQVARWQRAVANLDAEAVSAELLAEGTPIEGLAQALSSETPYYQLSLGDAEVLFDVLRQIGSVGRNRQRLNRISITKAADAMIDDCRKEIETAYETGGDAHKNWTEPKTLKDSIIDSLQSFFVGHIKIAAWCRIFDRNRDGGLLWNTFIRPANECAAREAQMLKTFGRRVEGILARLFAGKSAFKQDRVLIGNRLMSKGERVAAALNLGNASNAQRLVDGDPDFWNTDTVQQLISSLSSSDWAAIQEIWDTIEMLRPEIAAKQMRVYGETPTWIQPRELDVKTSDGKRMKLRGGYYPVKYDRYASTAAGVHDAATEAKEQLRGAFQSSTTNRSFTKNRADVVLGRPLRLNLDGLFDGLTDVIHDLCWHEYLIDANRLLRGVHGLGTGLSETIRATYGPKVAQSFTDWLQAIAQGGRIGTGAEGVLRFISGNVGAMSMGWSFTSAIAQLPGALYALPRVGIKHFSEGLRDFMSAPVSARVQINQNSVLMRNRADAITRDVADVKRGLRGSRNPIARNAYCMLVAVQNVVDTIVWLAAHRKAIAEGSTEIDALAIADQTVIDTQSSGNVHDLSAFERSEALRPFTCFYSWMNAALNMIYSTYRGERDRRKATRDLLFLMVVMPIVDMTFREMLPAPADDDDDDDDDIVKAARKFASAPLDFSAGLFIGTRELSAAIKNRVAGDRVFDYSGPAGTRALTVTTQLLGADPESRRFQNALLDIVGASAGLPSTQIKRTIKGFEAIREDKVEGADVPRALIFGYDGTIR